MAGFIREKQLVILLILFTRVPSHTGAGNVEKSILLFGLFSKNVFSQYDFKLSARYLAGGARNTFRLFCGPNAVNRPCRLPLSGFMILL